VAPSQREANSLPLEGEPLHLSQSGPGGGNKGDTPVTNRTSNAAYDEDRKGRKECHKGGKEIKLQGCFLQINREKKGRAAPRSLPRKKDVSVAVEEKRSPCSRGKKKGISWLGKRRCGEGGMVPGVEEKTVRLGRKGGGGRDLKEETETVLLWGEKPEKKMTACIQEGEECLLFSAKGAGHALLAPEEWKKKKAKRAFVVSWNVNLSGAKKEKENVS